MKNLKVKKPNKAGRSRGRVSVRHKGGGHKRLYRLVDFKRDVFDNPAKVLSIEYDPNRSARIALVEYKNGKKSYFLAPSKLKVNDFMVTSEKPEIKPGNRAPLKNLLIGTTVYNVAGMIRSAGESAILQAVEGGYAQLKMPSKEIRLVKDSELATIGQLSNPEHMNVKLRKAGQKRWRGIRPTVRGSAMSAGDHPHGGGEGRQGVGLKHPKTPWGKHAHGVKTRKKKKWSNKLIIRRKNYKRRK